MTGSVIAVSRDDEHRFSKAVVPSITLVAGHGVEGDAHAGATVQHRSRVARDPSQPNLRQVHLIHAGLLAALADAGYDVTAGQLGENVLTEGVDLLGLPRGTLLRLGSDAIVELTGLRNPCQQINGFAPGLLKEVLGRTADGEVERLCGVMGVVTHGGQVCPGDLVETELPAGERLALQPV